MDEFVVESPVEGPAAPVDPRRAILLPLWRGRHLVLAATLLGLIGGIFAGVIRPNSYRSYGKLMIRAGAREELTPEMSVTGNAGGYAVGGRNVVIDELHLLGAMQVFEEAARIVTPKEVFRPYDPSALDGAETSAVTALFHRWQSWWFRSTSDSDARPNHEVDDCDQCRRSAALVLSRSLSILPEPGSNVITISYTAHDPALAKAVVTAFLEAAVAQHRKIYETNSTLEFFRTHMEDSLRDLTAAENDFTNFKTECGVFDYATQQQTLLTEIHDLEVSTAQDASRIEALRAQTKDLTARLPTIPETLEERSEHNPQPNPFRAVLQQSILDLENSLATLDRTPGGIAREREKQRDGILQSIETTRKKLDEQPEFVDAGPSARKTANPRYAQLTQQLDAGRAELAALEGAAAKRDGQLIELRARLQSVAQCGPRFQSLDETTKEARHRYEGFRTQHERASLMGSMDQLEISNLRPIQEATLPSEKEGPLRGKLLMLGILLGGAVGCGLAFGRNLFDHRIHDAVELEQLLGTSVLADISQLVSPSKGHRTPRPVAP